MDYRESLEKESPYISITEEQERQGTIKCFIAAIIVTLGMFSVLIYGMAWISAVEKENTAFYGAKHLERRITAMEDEYKEHRHVYSTGKPNKPEGF